MVYELFAAFGYVLANHEMIEALQNPLIEVTLNELYSSGKLPSMDEIFYVAEAQRGKSEANQTTFSPDPVYDQVAHYTTTIAANGNPADVYYPVASSTANQRENQLPIVLMLQGALVDKREYSNYAETVARYGFIVVVPNHERTITGPNGQPITGFLVDQQEVNDVLDQMKVEGTDPASPIFEIADTEKLALLGHSLGGYAGLAAIQNICDPAVCSDNYTRPTELKAGIFYGANFQPSQSSELPPIDNQDIPVGLIAGTLDGVASFDKSASTYARIQNPPKALILVEGTNHYGITNADNARDPNRPTLNQATATETIGRWSGLFLRSHLLNDQDAFNYIYNTGGELDPNVSVISQTQSR